MWRWGLLTCFGCGMLPRITATVAKTKAAAVFGRNVFRQRQQSALQDDPQRYGSTATVPHRGDGLRDVPQRNDSTAITPYNGDGLRYVPQRSDSTDIAPHRGDGLHYVPQRSDSTAMVP